MKNLYIFLPFLLITLFVNGQTGHFQLGLFTEKVAVVSFHLPDHSFQEIETPQGRFLKINAEYSNQTLFKGDPEMPFYTFSLQIPEGVAYEIQVSDIDSELYTAKLPLLPSRGNISRDQDPSSVPYVKGQIYTVDKVYPVHSIQPGDTYYIRGAKGLPVRVFPFSWNPVSGELRVIKSITIRVHLKNGGNFLTGRRSEPAQFHQIYSRHFLNYNPPKDYDPLEEGGSMLVICNDEWMDEMQPLVDWKIQRGLPTEIIPVSEAGNTSNTIKSFISDYYDTHELTYVLLVGDDIHIPPVTSGVAGDSDNGYAYIVGEDHYPDLFIGRFSARTSVDVSTQVQRTLDYEKGELDDFDWIDKSMGIASQQGPGDDNEYDYQHIRNLQEQLVDYTYEEPYFEFYDGSQGGYDANNNPSSQMVIDGINDGTGAIWYCGHGVATGWSTSNFNNNSIVSLSNQKKLPFIVSTACLVGAFAGSDSSCFAEVWMRARQNGQPIGSVANFMSSINQPWNPPMEAQDEMVNILTEMYPDNLKYTFGGLAINGCYSMNDSYGSDGWEVTDTWIYFGDPSLLIRTDIPSTLSIIHPNFILEGINSVEINCDVDNTDVFLVHNDEIIGSGVVAGGSVNISIPSVDAGETIILTANGYNVLPYQAEILVTTDDPLVILENFSVNGIPALTYDQTQDIDLTLQNIGLTTAGNVSASLTTSDPAILNINGNLNVNFGSIPGSGGLSSSSGNFTVTVSGEISNMTHVDFELQVTDGNQTWNYNIQIPVYAPELGFESAAVSDPSAPPEFISNPLTYIQQGTLYYYEAAVTQAKGNGDANLDPGETLNLQFTLENKGDAAINDVVVEISSESDWIDIMTNQNTINLLAPGQSEDVSFTVKIDDNTPPGSQVEFVAHALAGYYESTYAPSLIVGRIDDSFETQDFNTVNWSFNGEAWLISDQGLEGTLGMESPPIENSEHTEISITFDALVADSVGFWFRVSSEVGCDEFVFKIDGEETCVYSGELSWQFLSLPLSQGTHTLTWRYQKDFIFSSGDDRVYIDAICLPPFENPTTTIRFFASQVPEWLTLEDQFTGSAILSGTAPMTIGNEPVELNASQNGQSENQQYNIEIGTVHIKNDDMEQVEVSPNPFSESVDINTRENSSFTLVVNDLQGKMVYLHTFPDGHSTIKLGSIPKGTYIFKVITNGRTFKKTVIKN